jgi:hypothetical protein
MTGQMRADRPKPSRRRLRALATGLAAASALAASAAMPAAASANPLDGNGMWIWYVSKAGGTAGAIADQANSYGLDTVLIKSSDGTSFWSQFTPELVQGLHNRDVNVCAWQFVYGSRPKAEARRGAKAVRRGADCLVIDAESHYEGRYKKARRYVKKLRKKVGKEYPVALAGFPYVDYHPSFPYSVFLGKKGAQYNVPQMYWHTIGTSVKQVYAHTYKVNQPYGRPIFPLGQTFDDPPKEQILAFRQYARDYGAKGVSWWSWQHTKTSEWKWLSQPLPAKLSGEVAKESYPRLGRGTRGDLVVQAQELLRAWGESVGVSGLYRAGTAEAVRDFQRAHDLRVTGEVHDATWRELLEREPASVRWSNDASGKRSAGSRGAPASASLPARHYEIPPSAGTP